MEKQIFNLTSGLLQLNRVVLFLLISLPITIGLYSKGSNTIEITNQIIATVSAVILLSWLFAIKYKSNEKLIKSDIYINILKYFNVLLLLTIIFYLLQSFATTLTKMDYNNIQIQYATPIIIPIVFMVSSLGILSVVAKALVSAELNKEAELKEYFTTILLLIFIPIGIWFIQPRVQQL